ncbi:hypothetical protein BDZ45DRAFT_201683 [Acephala macrosclerotiorum]|nr:hypothetical protein BDZ45DRAFT_201683 [Acephala macrosclerotiorum]
MNVRKTSGNSDRREGQLIKALKSDIPRPRCKKVWLPRHKQNPRLLLSRRAEIPRVMQHCIPFANSSLAFHSSLVRSPRIVPKISFVLLSSDPFLLSGRSAARPPIFFCGRGSALAGLDWRGRQILALLASASLSCIKRIFDDTGDKFFPMPS